MSELSPKRVLILPSAVERRAAVEAMEGEADYLVPRSLSPGDVRALVKKLRSCLAREFVIVSPDLDVQEKFLFVDLLAAFARTRSRTIKDLLGRERPTGWGKVLSEDCPYLVAEIVMGLIEILRTWRTARACVHRPPPAERTNRILPPSGTPVGYLRTNLRFGLRGGGSVSHTAGVIHALQRMGYPVHFFAPDPMPMIDPEETPTRIIRPPRLYNTFTALRPIGYGAHFRRTTLPLLRGSRAGILYHRCALGSLVLPPLAKQTQSLSILEFNSSEIWTRKNWGEGLTPIQRVVERLLQDIELANLRAADLVVTVSDVLRDQVIERGIDERRVISNPNGVDPQRFDPSWNPNTRRAIREKSGLPTDKILVTFVGTFERFHGTSVLAQAVAPTVAKNDRLHFLAVGTGVRWNEFCRILEDAGVRDRVTATGALAPERIPELLHASDILVSPHVPNPDGTRFFGSPTKLFEYMAAGRPIVASRLEQIADILRDDRTAILVTPGDLQELATVIADLGRDEERRKRLGTAALEEVQSRFTWDCHVKRILEGLQTSLR